MSRLTFPETSGCEKPIDYAIAYADAGLPVFPVEMVAKGDGEFSKTPHEILPKAPRGEGGFKHATTDTGQVRDWWTAAPGAHLGWYPGAAGCVVLDADGPEGIRNL